MAELYHLHLNGIRDDKWKVGNYIIVGNDFTNRLGKRISNFNDCTTNPRLENISRELNEVLHSFGYQAFSKMPLHIIMDYLLDPNTNINPQTQKIILQEVRNLAFQAAIFKRETAMELFRKMNHPDLPSRQHCLYATSENGIDYWKNRILDGDVSVFRIESFDEPFKTSEIFIPDESCNYDEMFKNSHKYWQPKLKNVPEESMEYLLKGRVKILEKVDEIKRKQ